MELVIPPVDEQRRIASLIGALDAVMTHAEVHHAALAILLKRRRSALFEGTITRPAREVFDILLGLQRSPARAAGPHRTPYLRSANVSARGLRLKDVKSMSFEPSQQAKYALSSGDVLVTEGSASVDAVGAASVYHGELPGTVCFQNTLLRFRPIEGVSTPAFAAQWCAWAYESGAFREAASGTSIKHVGARGAAAMPVADVSHHAQNDMTFALVLAEKAVRAAEETLQRLRDLRASLLIALLSGAHEIPDTYDHLLAG
ncbi:hypothetical protein [Aeromicrobium sp.]|uniref:hypothetical protein n=1 Tax=Aeromicrobium sp. TaxID=1871063 RepID=UPI0019AD28F3|nr:hypothetical protein [Aeromicrobium sp.]MBC7631727.1 hypothetical protein [Aeromicrobium sp.]